jgi:hypothetical protein
MSWCVDVSMHRICYLPGHVDIGGFFAMQPPPGSLYKQYLLWEQHSGSVGGPATEPYFNRLLFSRHTSRDAPEKTRIRFTEKGQWISKCEHCSTICTRLEAAECTEERKAILEGHMVHLQHVRHGRRGYQSRQAVVPETEGMPVFCVLALHSCTFPLPCCRCGSMLVLWCLCAACVPPVCQTARPAAM